MSIHIWVRCQLELHPSLLICTSKEVDVQTFFRFFTFDVDFRFRFLCYVFYLYFILTIANIYFCMSVIIIGNIWSICRIMWELGGPWVSSVR